MKIVIQSALIVLMLVFSVTSAVADKYIETRQLFENAGISKLFETAYGYALFPTIGKGGFVVGGSYGKGRVYEQGRYVGDASMVQASIGFQLGGTGFSQVVFFEDQRA